MKKMLVTAAALMLGTSALAWAPAEKAHMDAMGVEAASDWSKSAWSAEKSPLGFSSLEGKDMMKSESAGLESSASMMKGDAQVPAMFAKWEDPTVESASTASADMADVKGAVYAASLQEKSAVQTAAVDSKATTTAHAGMGGPIEEARGYPPCDPGPGDDNCIQLYERGVETSLAAWKGSEPEVAMGGPFEPAPASTKEQSSSSTDHSSMGHGQSSTGTGHSSSSTNADTGKPAATASAPADGSATKPAVPDSTAGTTPGAIGGPIEPVTAYPPCRPGRGDDRCIQLYERGVARRD